MSGKDNYTDSAPPLGFDQAWVDDNLKNGSGADLMTAQILKQGLYDKWTGEGFGSVYNNARSIADRLSSAGIKRLEDFGRRSVPVYTETTATAIPFATPDGERTEFKWAYVVSDGEGSYWSPAPPEITNNLPPPGPGGYDAEGGMSYQTAPVVKYQSGTSYEFYNKATGQKVDGSQQGKNVLDITYAGDGSTRMGVEFNDLGMPMFFTQYNGSSSDWGKIAPFLSIASFIPGVAPFAMAVNAIGSAYNGNYVGAILSAIGSANAFGSQYSTINPSAANAVNGMDAASDAAIGASSVVTQSANWIAQNAGNIKTAQQAVGLLNALDKQNVAGIISGLADIAPQVGITVPADIVKPINVAAMASAASKGDWAGALDAAKLITDNPTLRQDLSLASKATNFVNAINSGNPAAMMSSFMGLAREQNLGVGTIQQAAKQLGMPMSMSTVDKLMSSQDADQHVKDYYAKIQAAQDSAVAKTGNKLPDSFFLDYSGDIGNLKSSADDFLFANAPVEVPGLDDLEKILNFDKGTQTAGTADIGAATSWVPLAPDEKILGTRVRSDGAREATIERVNPADPSQKITYQAVLDPDTKNIFYETGGVSVDNEYGETVASKSKPSWSWEAEEGPSFSQPKETQPEIPEVPVIPFEPTEPKVPTVEDIIKELNTTTPSAQSTPPAQTTTPSETPTTSSPTTPVTTPGITSVEVEKIVTDAIKANPGLTQGDVQKIVSDAINTIPNLTANQVKEIVASEVSKLPVAATPSDVQKAVEDSAANQAAATQQAISGATKDLATSSSLENVRNDLAKEIQAARDMGLQGDAALQAGLDSLSAKMGVNQSDVLAKIGTTADSLRAEFGAGLESIAASQKDQYDSLSAAQKATADALVAQGKSMQDAIQQAQTQTASQIGAISTDLQAKYDALTAAQKAEANARIAQGQSLQDAISGVAGQVTNFGLQLTEQGKAFAAQLMQQGMDYQTALKTAIDAQGALFGSRIEDVQSQIAASEAARQADLAAQMAREQAAREAQAAAAREAERRVAIRTAAGQAGTQVQQIINQLPQAVQGLQSTTTPIYGGEITPFDLSAPLDVGFFNPSREKQGSQPGQQTTKIATGGYLDDLLDLLR